ncbi:MAG: hypothetical protein BAJATHORv1_10415 [Candidatus Thorarchaeota archaeon]|nr:MAG: hypothetical protein BAJATHORv1_10415 [Candidatus Thorarchaeota archaeon]
MTSDPLSGLFEKRFERPSDLLCCAYDLKSTELDAYFALLSGPKTVEVIAERIGRDRSTVQRFIVRLCRKGLVHREEKYLERGGRYYIYHAVSSEEVRDEILQKLKDFYEKTRDFLLNSWPEQS